MAQAMRARGVKRGDLVAVVASNSVDTLAVFPGVTALGGLFSSSSTHMSARDVCPSGPKSFVSNDPVFR